MYSELHAASSQLHATSAAAALRAARCKDRPEIDRRSTGDQLEINRSATSPHAPLPRRWPPLSVGTRPAPAHRATDDKNTAHDAPRGDRVRAGHRRRAPRAAWRAAEVRACAARADAARPAAAAEPNSITRHARAGERGRWHKRRVRGALSSRLRV